MIVVEGVVAALRLDGDGRGAGGQFIMMIDELNLIIAITSHNKGMGKMLKTAPERIIPAITSRIR